MDWYRLQYIVLFCVLPHYMPLTVHDVIGFLILQWVKKYNRLLYLVYVLASVAPDDVCLCVISVVGVLMF